MNSIRKMRDTGEVKRADGVQVRYESLHIEPGFNLRQDGAELEESIEALALHIIGGGKFPPLEVRPRDEGGMWIVDGHRRHAAIGRALERGAPLRSQKDGEAWIHVVLFDGNEEDRIARIITSANNKPLAPAEIAEGYKRLRAFNWTPAQIAKKVGKSVQHVQDLLALGDAPSPVRAMVKAGQVSATRAAKAVRRPRHQHHSHLVAHPQGSLMTATKIQPGNDTHLTLLMAPHSLNFVTGADRAALLAYGRDVFAAGREAKCLAQIQEPAQPVCWIRFCSDGSTEGPIMHSQICEARKTSGAWTPLYAGAAPAAVAGPADMRNALRWAAGGLRAVADDNDTLRIGSETRTVGEVLDAANAALEPAAPALEAPAAPAIDVSELAISVCQRVAELPDRNSPEGWPDAMLVTIDELGEIVRDEIMQALNGTLAAAPQAPAAPGGGYKLKDWGKPEYLDGAMARYSIEDARGNTIATIDDLPGDKAIADKLLAALNAPTEAPAAPAVDAPAVNALAPVQALLDMHAELLDANPYAYFELAYTRQTGWMAWITDKPMYGAQLINPERKVLARGHGDTPAEACAAAAHKGAE